MKHTNKAYSVKSKFYSNKTGQQIFIRPGDLIFYKLPRFFGLLKSKEFIGVVINLWGKLVVASFYEQSFEYFSSLKSVLEKGVDLKIMSQKKPLSAGEQYDLSRNVILTVFDDEEDYTVSDSYLVRDYGNLNNFKISIEVNGGELIEVVRGVTPSIDINK